MRSLTVKREKTFVGCAVKAKVYIADENGDTEINGVPCSFLGELKNNEKKTFEITEAETRVFVIADKISKDYCNDSRLVPAGTADVLLTGKNRFNLNNGNAFRFDGEPDDFAQLNRVNGPKKGGARMIIAIIVGLAVGFAAFVLPRIISNNKTNIIQWQELTATVKGNFESQKVDGTDASMLYLRKNGNLWLHFIRDPFNEYDATGISEKDYADYLREINSEKNPSSVLQEDGLTYFTYSATVPVSGINKVYHYYNYIFKGSKAFYVVGIYTGNEPSAKTLKEITDIAKSIKVN